MSDWISAASENFEEAVQGLPPSVIHSDRLLQPLLKIRKSENGFTAELFGQRKLGSETRLIPARTLRDSWVLDDSTVRPLPRDTGRRVSELLGPDPENLNFIQVVKLLQLVDPPFPIVAEETVLTPGRDIAAQLAPVSSPCGLNGELLPYQSRGVQWMAETIRHTGGIVLADEMGLGKTIQVISLLLDERPSPSSPALVVCPTSLIANWRREILKFAPGLSVMIHRGSHRAGTAAGLMRADVVISTYDTVVNDVGIFTGFEWSWLICDEAQAVKNPDSRRRAALASLQRRRTVPMTGTPVETSLQDLWSLVDLAIPGLLGERGEFLARYPDDELSAQQVSAVSAPVILRRRVADVAGDLPERIDIDVPLELGDELAARYEQVLSDTLRKYPVAGALVAAGQLQLFCAHPWLQANGEIDEADNADVLVSPQLPLITPKIERTISILEEAFLSGRKVLVFAIFNRCGDLIREAGKSLPKAFWGAINGSTPQADRQDIVDQFSLHAGPACLVLNPKAAGAGLNITAATIVIHYTQVWNPALEMQASARAHRRGQTEPVTIYRLFYEDTVERVMIDRSAWRRDLGNEAVPISTRDRGDLRRAIEIRPVTEND
jgi:SNF2 family DNA or RNA helicase